MVEEEEEKKDEEKSVDEENNEEETWWSFLRLEGESEESPVETKKPTTPDATNTPADAQPTPLFMEHTTMKQNEQSTNDNHNKYTNNTQHPAFCY